MADSINQLDENNPRKMSLATMVSSHGVGCTLNGIFKLTWYPDDESEELLQRDLINMMNAAIRTLHGRE